MSELAGSSPERRLWYEGANLAADAVVIDPHSSYILLIQRQDTGQWALPGGFIDPADESTCAAARRELLEEAGVSTDAEAPRIFHGRVDDSRNSATAWIETSAHLFTDISYQTPVAAEDDARHAAWHHLAEIPELYGSHRAIVEASLRYLFDEEV